jgi:uncharacterized peroxidase-related enzyme
MRIILLPLLLITLAASPVCAEPAPNGGLSSFAQLQQQAKARIHAKAAVELAPPGWEAVKGIETWDGFAPDRVPNYLRAFALMPAAAKPLANLVRTVVQGGTVAPDTKLAMGLRIAQVWGSPYVAAQVQRLLLSTEAGAATLESLRSPAPSPRAAALQLALAFAEKLSRSVHGVSDEDFRQTRGYYNDSQIVELTMTVCFFNYFVRFSEALNLPVEPWALEPPAARRKDIYRAPLARVALISDEQISAIPAMASSAASQPSKAAGGWGIGVANSQRAMVLVPELHRAWRGFGSLVREHNQVSRELKLHVSFAVSMANECRYCVLHQVLGLRRLNIDPAKLVAMKKDDSALSPQELTAVQFARKLTREPSAMGDADYQKLRAAFSDAGAFEVLLQTCNFAFMNRFTDGLHLPSEDEAVRVYREVYGTDWAD